LFIYVVSEQALFAVGGNCNNGGVSAFLGNAGECVCGAFCALNAFGHVQCQLSDSERGSYKS